MSLPDRPLALAASSLSLIFAAPAFAAESVWTFGAAGDPLAADSGPGTLAYYDPGGTGWGPVATAFGKATSFGLPAMADGDPDVLSFPACSSGEGYTLTHGGDPNGVFIGEGLTSNYSIIFDIYFPASSDGLWRALFQCDPGNADDAEIYVQNTPSGGIGISGVYEGSVSPGEWHRLAITVRSAPGEGQLHKYIDGTFVGGQGTTGRAISERWAAQSVLRLLTDDNGETAAGYLASLYFIDRQLTMDEVAALGKPSAAGANQPGAPGDPLPHRPTRRVGIVAHRGNSCCAPENTLPALEQAFDRGAEFCEIDTRLSADGTVVLMHDATIDRTTDGTGDAAAMTVAQLKTHDAGSWFSDAYIGTRVPTLEEALVLAKSKGGKLYLDLKVDGQGAAILAAANAAGVPYQDIWLWVYNDAAEAQALRSVMPEGKIIWGDPGAGWESDPDYFSDLRALGVYGFDLGNGSGNIDPAFAYAARDEGFVICNYTILGPDAMVRSIENGTNYIETDFPEILRAILPPFSVEFRDPAPISHGTPLGAAQLDAAADIAGAWTYAPPAGTVLPPGAYPIAATFTPDDAATYPDPVTVGATIEVTPPVPESFPDWAARLGISADPAANDDHDALTLIEEYALGGSPFAPDANLGIGGVEPVEIRLSRTAVGVDATFQYSGDLVGWMDGIELFGGIASQDAAILSLDDNGIFWALHLDPPPLDGAGFYRLAIRPTDPAALLNANLIANPDAELGAPGVTAGQDTAVPGWEDASGLITAQAYNGYGVDDPGQGGSYPGAEFGSAYFYGGEGWGSSAGSADLRQVVDLSPAIALVDAGGLTFAASGWFGGWGAQDDTALLIVRFLDFGGAPLVEFQIGGPSAADRGSTSMLIEDSASGAVPVGARQIEITLRFTKASGGTYGDGSADRLSLILSD
ncbi:MAG: glycerophosphodiester phosphodiesterase family protein [Verrucomicrobiales bacterium]